MSSVVAEANAQLSSQISKPKSGQGGQSSSSGGFSGLVDSNLEAAADVDVGAAPAKPRKASTTAAADQEPTRTGLHQKKSRNAEPAQKSVPGEKHATQNEPQPAETTVEATLAIEAAVKTGIVGATMSAEQVEAAPETTAEQAPQPVGPATTGIVVAVAVPTETLVAVSTAPVIESSEAISVTNPPATVATPAEIAANALAKVAAETGDANVKSDPEAMTTVQTPAATAEATPETAATVEGAGEAEPVIETAAADVQVEAKAKTELAATIAKSAEPSARLPPLAHAKPEGATKIEPVDVKEQPAPERPQGAKPLAHDDHRVEQKPAPQASSEKPADTEAKPAQHSSAPEPAQVATHAQADKPQPNGFGLTQVAALHVPNVALQSAAFTAVAATASAPVPINGLAIEIAANVQIGRSRFEIRLDPPELGRIDVRLDVDKQGQVTSHLIVEKSATLDLLRRDAQQLERALQDAGLKTSDNGLQFSLRDQQQSGRNNDDGSQRNAQRLIVTDEDAIAVETAGRSYGRMIGQRGGVDIRV